MDVRGRRATVMGLGRHGGGVAAARWLAREGAIVTVTDLADAAALADSITALADVDIAQWHLGGHRASDFDSADLVVVNPAVRLGHPLVARAAARGSQVTSELELFIERCPGQVAGITGSNGKSTTAAMLAEILRADGRPTFLGGNIGHSLLADLDAMNGDCWSVLEISSFQLAWLSADFPRPSVAVLTNFSPNHLDWHGTVAAYAGAKMRLFSGQQPGDKIVADLAKLGREWAAATGGIRVEPVADAQIPDLQMPGAHNRQNAASAAAAARAIGCSATAIEAGLQGFRGLPHRLELVGTLAGREFYNDSMATTPESAMAALATFSGRCWLLVGGYDKGIDMAALVAAIARRARGVACYGASGPRLHAQLTDLDAERPTALFDSLDAAFAWCWSGSQCDECIVLSPACASFDQFLDYRARGERFRSLVRALGAPPIARNDQLPPATSRRDIAPGWRRA
jgi:UDP-N-acetylmuramoylalanine--D-glutamate ligase